MNAAPVFLPLDSEWQTVSVGRVTPVTHVAVLVGASAGIPDALGSNRAILPDPGVLGSLARPDVEDEWGVGWLPGAGEERGH